MATLREFYQKTYPTDDLGSEINLTSFVALLDCLHRGGDVYQYIGVGDSLIRERLFQELAKMIGSNYDYVYNLWMQVDKELFMETIEDDQKKNEMVTPNDGDSDSTYIDYLNKDKNFKQDRIEFKSYEDAVKWAKENLEKFNLDMIHYN